MSIPSISIQNKNGVTMLIDEEDLGLLAQHKDGHWCFVRHHGYAIIVHKKGMGGDGKNIAFHRLIMNASVGLEVNHINGNKLDNRRENLRLCNSGQHRLTTVGYGSSKFKGAYKKGSKWQAAIQANGASIYLGTFPTEVEAALAYDAKARQLGCGVRFLNFPDEVNDV